MSTSLTRKITPGTTQTQDGGAPLQVGVNIALESAGNDDALTLPNAPVGATVIVKNTSELVYLQVFPGVGDTIDDGSANASVKLPTNSTATFVKEDDANWELSISGKGDPVVSGVITASTTDAQGEQPLTLDWNQVNAADVTNNAVTLPAAATGMEVVVRNTNASNTLKVYPASGDKINALAIDAAITVGTGTTVVFRAFSASQWYSQ